MAVKRAGFTLIELLIVVVIIGILAIIAIPKFQETTGKANAAVIKSDLRNLSAAEESYLFDYGTYSSDMTAMNLFPSPGVVITITGATNSGWAATATHPASYPMTCALFEGNIPPQAPATTEALVGCR